MENKLDKEEEILEQAQNEYDIILINYCFLLKN